MVSEMCFSLCAGSMRKVLRKHDARGSSCGSSWQPYVSLETLFAEGSVEARCVEVPTKRRLVFPKAQRKLMGGRVVISKGINKE